jgi:hypothetical protein
VLTEKVGKEHAKLGFACLDGKRVEAAVGVEPTIRVLQTLALPLGHAASVGQYSTILFGKEAIYLTADWRQSGVGAVLLISLISRKVGVPKAKNIYFTMGVARDILTNFHTQI